MDAKNVIIRSVHLERRAKVDSLKVSLEQAQDLFCQHIPKVGTELKSLEKCQGRILAKPVFAGMTQPPFARSAMDGYAVRSADIRDVDEKHPVPLTVTDCIYAGEEPKQDIYGMQAVRIMTGAMIPDGADCVVKQEDTKADPYDKNKIWIYHSMKPGENYCPKGEDFKKGERLADIGDIVDAYMTAAFVAAGVQKLEVFKRLKISVITTGDEIRPADSKLEPGNIYDANGAWLCMRIKEMGCELAHYCIVGDSVTEIENEIKKAKRQSDLILTTGGVSVGEKDVIPDVIDRLGGKIIFRGIEVKPGMPTMFSVSGEMPVLSLSGNPFAVTAIFEMLVGDLLTRMPESAYAQQKKKVPLVHTFFKSGKMKRIAKGRMEKNGVVLPPLQRNGQTKNGIKSNCLVLFPEGEKQYSEGGELTVIQI